MRATSRQAASSLFCGMARSRAVAAAIAGLPLAGCAMQYDPVLSDRAVMPGYSVSDIRALAGRTIKVDVYGDPFAAAPYAFAGQVASNMNQSSAAPGHFTAHPATDPTAPYRVVWNFSPPRESVAPNQICRTKSVPPNNGRTPIDVAAAFCYGEQALTSVRGSLYYTGTQNSIEFLRLVDAVTTQLFPVEIDAPRRSGDSRLGKPNFRVGTR
jgi:hypothetical protein